MARGEGIVANSSKAGRTRFFAMLGVLILVLILFGLDLWHHYHLPAPIISEIKGNTALVKQIETLLKRAEAAEATLRWAATFFTMAGLVISLLLAWLGVIGYLRLEEILKMQKEVEKSKREFEEWKDHFFRSEVRRFESEKFAPDEKLFLDQSDLVISIPRGWELATSRDWAYRNLFGLRMFSMMGDISPRHWSRLGSDFLGIGKPGLAAARYLEAAELEKDPKRQAAYYFNCASALVRVYEEDQKEYNGGFHLPTIEKTFSCLKTALAYYQDYPDIRFMLAYVIDDLIKASPRPPTDATYEAAIAHLDYCIQKCPEFGFSSLQSLAQLNKACIVYKLIVARDPRYTRDDLRSILAELRDIPKIKDLVWNDLELRELRGEDWFSEWFSG